MWQADHGYRGPDTARQKVPVFAVQAQYKPSYSVSGFSGTSPRVTPFAASADLRGHELRVPERVIAHG